MAVLVPLVMLLVCRRLLDEPVLGDRVLYMAFFPAVLLAAYLGGFWPGLLATVVSALGATYFLVKPLDSFEIATLEHAVALTLFVLLGMVISGLIEALHGSRRHIAASERRYGVTLASIGDAVIATDDKARVTFLNPVAEALTGWPLADAVGRPLAEVFRIVNEQTRERVEDPAAKVLRLGTVVGLANHTALLARDGREVPIDDCGAPIIDDRDAMAGVVLVFRDTTQRRRAEEAELLRRANARLELAFRGSGVGVWEIEMPDGDFLHGRQNYVNIWEQLGYEGAPRDRETAAPEMHPDDVAPNREAVRRYLASETTEYEDEVRLRHTDDSYRTMLARGAAVRDAADKPIRFVGVIIDITERKRAEEALRVSNERLRIVTMATNDAVWDWDLGTNKVWWNEGVRTLFGYDLEDGEADPEWWLERVHHDDREAVERFFFDAVHGTELSWVDEYRFRCADGSYKDVYDRSYIVRDADGRATRMTGAMLDISERKRAEEALAQERYLLHALMDNIPDNIYFKDAASRFVLVNKALTTYFGLGDPAQAIGKTDFDFFTDEHARAAREDEERIMRTDQPVVGKEERETWLDGRVRWVSTTKMPFREKNGQILGTFGVSREITNLKRAEEALQASERRFRILVDNATDAFLLHDEQGRILDVNRRACESLGYSRDELVGMTALDFDLDITPDDMEEIARKLIAGEVFVHETRHRRKDGTTFPVEVRGQAFWEGGRQFFVALVRDMTERKRAEEALRASEHRFRTFVDHAADAFFLHDRHDDRHVVVDVNRQACESLGFTRDELIGMIPTDFDPDVTPADLADINHKLSAGEKVAFEARHRRKDGTTFPVEVRGQAFWEDGRLFSVTLVRDMTERKRAEEALRASERRFRTLVDHATDAFFLVNDRHVVLDVNRQACLSLGYTRDDLVGMTSFDFDIDVTPPMLEEQGRQFDDGEVIVFESRHRRKDGSVFPVEVRSRLFREGGQQFAVALARDMTERKRAEEALRASERRFRTLAEALPNIVWTAEPDGAVDYVNARITEYSGLTPEQTLGWGWELAIHPEELPRFLELWTRSIATGELYENEFRLCSADCTYRWHLSRALPLRDDSGRITKWVGFAIDIDDQKRAQEALRQAKEAAEAASRAKDEFLANVSHEIRTPMNAILGMTELALDTPLTGEQREYLAIVKSSAEALLKVINDLLDFAKIEAGKLELDHADFSLRHVLGETLRALAFRAHRKGLELACRISPEVPDALIGDAGRLRQVLLNLIGNAIKFTEHGEVVVRVEAGAEQTSTESDPPEPGSRPSQLLHFSVSDTGIGIPREKQEKIFQAFEQVDSSTTRRFEGTGLGLSIAARLVALMGGRITVESEPGRGSTFLFTAGFGSQPHPPSGPPERPLVDLHGLRVLVVDDNATNRQILDEWLRGWHTEPTAVADGFQALDALWSAVSVGRPFALVLLDGRMPGTDGLTIAESILQSPVLSKCRIILLTSEELHGDIVRYRERGIAAWAMKPVPQEELLEIIYRVLSRPDSADVAVDRTDLIAAADATAATTVPSTRRLRILVAEDTPFNQQLFEHLLRRKGHDVRVSSDGHEALAALEQDRFDLMLLDVHMPGCDGFQVIEALRQREQATGGHLPVIALTARAMTSDRERCLQAGMDDYLAKPVGAAELVRVMDRVLAGRPAAKPVPPGRGRPESLLDPVTLRAACDDDATLLLELIQVFQADTPGALARVRDAVDQQDASRLREAAHALRGLLSTFSATAAAEAARLETMGAGGQLDDAASTLDGLAEMVDRLGPLLEELSIDQLQQQIAGGGPV
jgi:PAS domain S-box-containing protein